MFASRRWLALLCVASAVALSACAHRPPAGEVERAAASVVAERALTILVSIDGFRPDYMTAQNTPTLFALSRTGVFADKGMRPSFPSLTFPNHYTIVTGLRPDHHGVVSNTFEDPGIPGTTFKMSNKAAVGDRRWWDEATPLWVTAERSGVKTATMFWPGSDADIQGVRPSWRKQFDQSLSSAARVDTLLGWLDDPAGRPGFATLYFDIVDTEGHHYGPKSPQVAKAANEVDAALGRLVAGLKAKGLDGKVNIVVVADHGMAATPPGQVVIADRGLPAGAVRMVTGGPVGGFVPAAGQEQRVETVLLKRQPHMTCWRKGQIPARYAYGTNPRVPPIVCLAQTGWMITTAEAAARRKPDSTMGGAHGYDPFDPNMAALFLATGPDIRAGKTVGVFDNVDVYPLLARLIGVTPERNDGEIPKGVLR